MTELSSIDAKAGRLFTLKVFDADNNALTIGGLQSTDMTLNGAPVDITNVASEGWAEYLPGAGTKSLSISGNGVFDSLTPGAIAVWNAALAQDTTGYIKGQVISGHGDSFVGMFVVDNYRRTGQQNGAETFSISMKSSGPPVYTPAP